MDEDLIIQHNIESTVFCVSKEYKWRETDRIVIEKRRKRRKAGEMEIVGEKQRVKERARKKNREGGGGERNRER